MDFINKIIEFIQKIFSYILALFGISTDTEEDVSNYDDEVETIPS